MWRWFRFSICLLFLSITQIASADSDFLSDLPDLNPVQAELLLEDEAIHAGRPFWVAVHLKIQDNWHSYWKNPGDSGMATTIEWNLPAGFKAGPIEWPFPQRFDLNSSIGFGYERDVVLLTQITPPEALPMEKKVDIEAAVKWVVCSDSNCVPGNADLTLAAPISLKAPKPNPVLIERFAQARAKLPQKYWNIQAKKQDHVIEILIQTPRKYKNSIAKAYFFPDSNQLIDHQSEPLLNKLKKNDFHYSLLLKALDSEGPKPKFLRGVLILQSESNPQVAIEAIEVNIPLSGRDQEETIGLAEIPAPARVIEKKSVKKSPIIAQKALSVSPSQEFEGGFFLALGLAFIGGMILNLMPCVLPVVSFKILSFVKMAGQSRTLTLKHGLAFSVGVLASFWVLAGTLLALQAYGQSVGWGFQLQEPLFVAILAAIMLVFGLSLFGLFEMGVSVTSWAGQAQSNSAGSEKLLSSFFSGILATAVATPCTGPFLGSAIGFAVTLSAPLALLIFTSLGFGMAFPYLLLSAFPSLLRFLPKPGNWMITFKELMGFFMLATVLWLMWVFAAQTNTIAIFILLLGFFSIALGCWIYGKWASPIKSFRTRMVGSVFAFGCMLFAAYAIFASTSSWVMALGGNNAEFHASEADEWEQFSPERVAELQEKGIPVFIDFTAKWCLICQTNHLVLSSGEIPDKFKELGVVKMKADWTKNDPVITQELKKFGRNGVPLYLLYGREPSEQPQILPQVLTPDTISQYLEKMEEPLVLRTRGKS